MRNKKNNIKKKINIETKKRKKQENRKLKTNNIDNKSRYYINKIKNNLNN